MHAHDSRSSWSWGFAALAAALSLPVTARPATVTPEDSLISIEKCLDRGNQALSLSWDLGSSAGKSIEILGSSVSACSDSSATTAVLVEGLSPTRTSYPAAGEADITLAQLLDAAGKVPPDGCEGADFYVYVCVRLLDSSGEKVASGSSSIEFQLRRPPPPEKVEVAGIGEQALYVSFSAGTSKGTATAASKKFQAFASASGGTPIGSGETTSTSKVRIGGLENGTTYDVWVVAYSEAGNASAKSELSAGTPQQVLDFGELYHSKGGVEQGGCSQGGACGFLALLCAAWMARRASSRRPGPPRRNGLERAGRGAAREGGGP